MIKNKKKLTLEEMPEFNEEINKMPLADKIFVDKAIAIADRVSNLCELKGITQRELAKIIFRHESSLSRSLNRKHNLTLRTLSEIEAALGGDVIFIPSSQIECCGAWVKCSERQPTDKIVETYFVKLKVKDSDEEWFPGTCTFSGEWEISKGYEVVEWLDESLPCNDKEKDELRKALEDLVDAVPRQLEDADWWDDSLTNAVNKAKQLLK